MNMYTLTPLLSNKSFEADLAKARVDRSMLIRVRLCFCRIWIIRDAVTIIMLTDVLYVGKSKDSVIDYHLLRSFDFLLTGRVHQCGERRREERGDTRRDSRIIRITEPGGET